MEILIDKAISLMWFLLTSFGSITIGIFVAGYILAFVQKTQPDWIKVGLISIAVLVPCFLLIWFGIHHNEWNILVAIVWTVIISAAFYIGMTDQYKEELDAKNKDQIDTSDPEEG